MYERILLPTDGSAVAETAAEAAVEFASRFDATLHVVHVLEVGDLPPGLEDREADAFATRGNEALSAVAEAAADAGVDVTTTVVDGGGPIHRAILTYADDHAIDCIVMGTHGRTGLDRFVLGSVAERVLRASPVPVMTVHGDTVVEAAPDTVLVPTDGSACAQAAADHAIELALATDAALHVVHVVDSRVLVDDSDAGMVLNALEAAGERALRSVIDRAKAAGVASTESSVLSGIPFRAIVDYADDRDVDCIVMGTHGRTGIRRYLLGSATERVVRLTDIPVIAVKDPDTAD